jgi:hypothetical protein
MGNEGEAYCQKDNFNIFVDYITHIIACSIARTKVFILFFYDQLIYF